MDEAVFRGIVDGVVAYSGQQLIAQYPGDGLGWKEDDWQAALQTKYGLLREQIRGQMYVQPDLKDHRIDRHKVAAAFTKTIMQVQPLRTTAENPSAGGRLANEALAFLTGARIVQRFLVRRFKSQKDIADRIAKTPVSFPPANDCVYPAHAYKALFNAGHAGLNVFVLSNLYFLIESFHLQSMGIAMPVPPEGKEGLSGLL